MRIFLIDRPGLGVLVFMPAYNSGTRPVGQTDDECLTKYLSRCRETGQILDTDTVYYEDSDNLPDRGSTFADAWEWRGGKIVTNLLKAKEIQRQRLYDVYSFELMLLQEKGETSPGVISSLENVWTAVELDTAETIAELNEAWPDGFQPWPPARPEER